MKLTFLKISSVYVFWGRVKLSSILTANDLEFSTLSICSILTIALISLSSSLWQEPIDNHKLSFENIKTQLTSIKLPFEFSKLNIHTFLKPIKFITMKSYIGIISLNSR